MFKRQKAPSRAKRSSKRIRPQAKKANFHSNAKRFKSAASLPDIDEISTTTLTNNRSRTRRGKKRNTINDEPRPLTGFTFDIPMPTFVQSPLVTEHLETKLTKELPTLLIEPEISSVVDDGTSKPRLLSSRFKVKKTDAQVQQKREQDERDRQQEILELDAERRTIRKRHAKNMQIKNLSPPFKPKPTIPAATTTTTTTTSSLSDLPQDSDISPQCFTTDNAQDETSMPTIQPSSSPGIGKWVSNKLNVFTFALHNTTTQQEQINHTQAKFDNIRHHISAAQRLDSIIKGMLGLPDFDGIDSTTTQSEEPNNNNDNNNNDNNNNNNNTNDKPIHFYPLSQQDKSAINNLVEKWRTEDPTIDSTRRITLYNLPSYMTIRHLYELIHTRCGIPPIYQLQRSVHDNTAVMVLPATMKRKLELAALITHRLNTFTISPQELDAMQIINVRYVNLDPYDDYDPIHDEQIFHRWAEQRESQRRLFASHLQSPTTTTQTTATTLTTTTTTTTPTTDVQSNTTPQIWEYNPYAIPQQWELDSIDQHDRIRHIYYPDVAMLPKSSRLIRNLEGNNNNNNSNNSTIPYKKFKTNELVLLDEMFQHIDTAKGYDSYDILEYRVTKRGRYIPTIIRIKPSLGGDDEVVSHDMDSNIIFDNNTNNMNMTNNNNNDNNIPAAAAATTTTTNKKGKHIKVLLGRGSDLRGGRCAQQIAQLSLSMSPYASFYHPTMSLLEQYLISPAVGQYFQRNAAYDGGIASESEVEQLDNNNNMEQFQEKSNNDDATTPATITSPTKEEEEHQETVYNAYGVAIKPNPIYTTKNTTRWHLSVMDLTNKLQSITPIKAVIPIPNSPWRYQVEFFNIDGYKKLQDFVQRGTVHTLIQNNNNNNNTNNKEEINQQKLNLQLKKTTQFFPFIANQNAPHQPLYASLSFPQPVFPDDFNAQYGEIDELLKDQYNFTSNDIFEIYQDDIKHQRLCDDTFFKQHQHQQEQQQQHTQTQQSNSHSASSTKNQDFHRLLQDPTPFLKPHLTTPATMNKIRQLETTGNTIAALTGHKTTTPHTSSRSSKRSYNIRHWSSDFDAP